MNQSRCVVPGCAGQFVARGLCRKHYQRWWKRGTLEVAPGYEQRTLRERFDSKVVRAGSGCWTWSGTHDANGYAKFGVGNYMANAHRVAYELYVGAIPAGLEVDHLCRNRGCVNPEHLEAVPKRVNILRGEGVGAKYARRTHCKYGHDYTPENTRGGAGTRMCRECERLRSLRRWAEDPQEMRRRERARIRPRRTPKRG